MIVQYFERDGLKQFDVVQALADSGWDVDLDELPTLSGLVLADRSNPEHRVTVSEVTCTQLFKMWFVHYVEGGWQCLDHAIEQFTRA